MLPPGVKVSYEFDQSPYVTRAILGLTEEGLLGAVLTGLVVLLFLREWRSALVVVVNIPLSILAAIIALWASGQTVNLMTLGGLALAVGILVDEATVTIENVHSHLGRGAAIAYAAYDGTSETTVPRFLAMLCILAVFVSAFFMQGAAHNLFVPLALAVGFAMVASYVLSSTLVPVLLIWILRTQHDLHAAGPSRFDRFRDRYHDFSARVVRRRWIVVPAYLAVAGLIIVVLGGTLGRAIFPTVDAGQFTLRMRATAGTRIEETEKLANKTLDIIRREAGPQNVGISLGFVGVQNAYPINTIYLWTSGPQEAVLQLQLNPKAGIRVADLEERLRQKLSQELPGVRYSFEPSDIISRVMSFGSPTPIEVAVSGPDFTKTRPFAQKLQKALGEVSSLRDLEFERELDYPAVKVDIDRQLAGMLGVTVDQVSRSLTEATSSSRFTVPNFWADPKSGVGYQVQVEVPLPIDDMLVTAVRYRPDLEAVRTLWAAAQADQGATVWGGLGPQVQAARTFLTPPPASAVVDTMYRQQKYVATGGFNWSAATFGRIKSAVANVKIAELDLDRELDHVGSTVVSAHQASLTAAKLIPIAKQQVTSAEEALRLTKENLKAGTGQSMCCRRWTPPSRPSFATQPR